jgi:hypothetical protein
MNDKILGSCLCGQVKFEIKGNFEAFFLCHCKYCQKDTGSAHAANLVSAKANLSWLAGEVTTKTFILPGTRHTKTFCKDCGSALPSRVMDGKILVVPAGSLDSKVDVTPNAHIFYASKAGWDQGLEHVPKFDQFPND